MDEFEALHIDRAVVLANDEVRITILEGLRPEYVAIINIARAPYARWPLGVASQRRSITLMGPVHDTRRAEEATRKAVDEVVASGPRRAVALMRLLEPHADFGGLSTRERSLILSHVRTNRPAMPIVESVDTTDTTDADGTRHRVTLSKAQHVAQRVRSGAPLTSRETRWVAEVLESAPPSCGYWGPIKTLVKLLDPVLTPSAFGTALGSLARAADGRVVTFDKRVVQDLTFLRDALRGPRQDTLDYVARRARRELAALASESPETYAQVCSSMLLAWDSDITPHSFLPAFVLHGGGKYLHGGSRRVRTDLDFATRSDAYPEIWNLHLDEVRTVFEGVVSSAESQAWAWNVLRACAAEPPAFTADTVTLALVNQYGDTSGLLAAACRSLPRLSDAWRMLNAAHWTRFLAAGDVLDFDAVLDAVANAAPDGGPPPALAAAAIGLLGAGGPLDSHRQTRLAILYASHLQRQDADSSELGRLVRGFVRLLHDTAVDETSLTIIEAVIEELCADDVPDEVLRELSHANVARARGLAVRLALRAVNHLPAVAALHSIEAWDEWGDLDSATALIASGELIATSDTETILQVLRVRSDAESALLPGPMWPALLLAAPHGADAAWEFLADDPSPLRAIVIEDELLVEAMGARLTRIRLNRLHGAQVAVLKGYLATTPSRISEDPRFGVAVAAVPDTTLQELALAQLREAKSIPTVWLQLAEARLPLPLATAEEYLLSLPAGSSRTDAVRSALDSSVPAVRALGLRAWDADPLAVDEHMLLTSLTESRHPEMQARVADAADRGRFSSAADLAALAEFDHRVLVTRRGSRHVLEQVKSRIDAAAADASTEALSNERLDALLRLARGSTARDREWALVSLAKHVEQGHVIPGVVVGSTSEEVSS